VPYKEPSQVAAYIYLKSILSMIIISGQNNLTKRPHRRRTWTVQSYSPCGANVHPHLTHASLGPSKSIRQTASRSVQPFAQLTAECPHTLQWTAPPLSLRIDLAHGASGPPSNMWLLGPTRVHNPNGRSIVWPISISSAIFAGLTDRQTNQPTCSATPSVAVGRI